MSLLGGASVDKDRSDDILSLSLDRVPNETTELGTDGSPSNEAHLDGGGGIVGRRQRA